MASTRSTAHRWIAVAAVVAAGTGLVTSLTGPAAAAPPQPAQSAPSVDTSWLPSTPPGWSQVVDHSATTPSTITRGVRHWSETYDSVAGREKVQLLDVNLSDPNVRLGAVESHDRVQDPRDETTSSMAARTGAVAGVNGGYFAINATGEPLGGTVRDGRIVKSPRPNFAAQLAVRPDGSVVMGQQTYSGTVTDGDAHHDLTSVNTVGDAATGGITRITAELGTTGTLPKATLVTGRVVNGGLVVDTVTADVTSVPALPSGSAGLLGGGDGATWLTGNVHVGDTLHVHEQLSPDTGLTQLISGVDVLVKDGRSYDDPTGTPPDGATPHKHPETAIGVSRDGRRAMMITVDGEQGDAVSNGVTPTEATGLLLAHGAWSGMLFDGGGSTTMVTRPQGHTTPSVANIPSDASGERPVANGIFVYSTARAAGPARQTTVNHGRPVTTVPGARLPLSVYALDAFGNPAAQQPTVAVVPPGLGHFTDRRTFQAGRAGDGYLVARAGSARAVVPLHVTASLSSLAVSPTPVDLGNGATQRFSLSATATAHGRTIPAQVPSTAATWTVSPSGLGTVDAAGVFTAAANGTGLVTVTARVGGRQATSSVAVGQRSVTIAPFDDAAAWSLRNTTGNPATLTTEAGAIPPGSALAAGTQLTYSLLGHAGVKQLVLSPKNGPVTAPLGPDGQAPNAVALWVHGDGSGIDTAVQFVGADGTRATVYPTFVTWKDWHLVTVPIPSDLTAPVSIGFIDFLGINPDHDLAGTLQLSNLRELFSPRPVIRAPYVPVPRNPSWLRYSEDPAQFSASGPTVLTGDDAHLLAADPESASSHVLKTIAQRLPQLPPTARPQAVQMLGDMPDDGKPADLQYTRDSIAALGLPYRNAVGNHEITQGADPENVNYRAAFGDTHYAYTLGAGQSAASVVVTDSAHGGILASDAYQVPAEAQYPWLVGQLSAATSSAILVVTHMPAYDPHAAADSQFTNRWEAREYVRLVQRYQQTHPSRHVVMLYGHARGFSEQLIDPDGRPTDAAHGAVPQLTFADLGMPPYAPTDQGGFYHYGLVHVTDRGDVQFAVQPVLASIALNRTTTMHIGHHTTLSATGTMVGGDNQPTRTMPIADPASHVWTSSDPRVVSVDARTGRVVAHRIGRATMTVRSGGVSASTTVTVVH